MPNIPSFAIGRKGQRSIVDCMVSLLWRSEAGGDWPVRTFSELREEVSKMQGYDVKASTIRSTIYMRTDVFEKVSDKDNSVRWRLTKTARTRRPS